MGPACPHCGVVYEWTCGEIEELVTCPKIYFCGDCRGMFILTAEEVTALQERYRPSVCEEPERYNEEPETGPDLGESDGGG